MNKQKRIVDLTKHLVSIPSVVNSDGEHQIAHFIYNWLSELDYFKRHSNHLIKVDIPNDPLNRFNVMALIKIDHISETVIGIGHFDTVDVLDFGSKKELAFKVDALKVELQKSSSNHPHINHDQMLFGRGVLDMKSGVAIWMELLKEVSEDLSSYDKNLVVTFVCDEEGTSLGMRHSIQPLLKMRNHFNLKYLGAIDTDYTTQQYPDDPFHYVYFGTVGKLLVNFVAVGVESHASDPFSGVDANFIVSEIVREINMNPKYTDHYQNKTTPVPITLHMQNQDKGYSVQTSKLSWVYFNVTTYQTPVTVWMKRFKKAAEHVMAQTMKTLNKRYQKYCKLNEIDYKPLYYQPKVMLIDELNVKPKQLHQDERINDFLNVQAAIDESGIDQPSIIVYLSNPYYPAHTVTANDQTWIDLMMHALSKNYTNQLQVAPYYPYISDLSFLRAPSTSDCLAVKSYLVDNQSFDDGLWQNASLLNCPMVNIGPYGFDAHKHLERVDQRSIVWVYNVLSDVLKKD
jgi:arginine utilization protein RocB